MKDLLGRPSSAVCRRRWRPFFLVLFLVAGTVHVPAQWKQKTYISPGLFLTMDLHGELEAGAKLSIGTTHHLVFRNMTVELRRRTDDASDLFMDVEYQQGRPDRYAADAELRRIQSGFGAGVTFPLTGKDQTPGLRLSVFNGYLYYVRGTVTVAKSVTADAGFEVVLPILFDALK